MSCCLLLSNHRAYVARMLSERATERSPHSIPTDRYETDVLMGATRTIERDHPAAIFEVEGSLFAGHDPYGPVKLLTERYNYTCFKPVPCGTQPRGFGNWPNGGGGFDHMCLWAPAISSGSNKRTSKVGGRPLRSTVTTL